MTTICSANGHDYIRRNDGGYVCVRCGQIPFGTFRDRSPAPTPPLVELRIDGVDITRHARGPLGDIQLPMGRWLYVEAVAGDHCVSGFCDTEVPPESDRIAVGESVYEDRDGVWVRVSGPPADLPHEEKLKWIREHPGQ